MVLLVLFYTLGRRRRASIGPGPCQGIPKRAAGDGERRVILPRAGWSAGRSQARGQARRVTTLYIRTNFSRKAKMEMTSRL